MNGAGHPQQRGEIADGAASFQHLVIEGADETRRGHLLARGNLVENRPEQRLQANARAVSVETDRARYGLVQIRILSGENPAHPGVSSPANILLYSLSCGRS